jgi:ABC-type molybdate transport system substrate-binding protein
MYSKCKCIACEVKKYYDDLHISSSKSCKCTSCKCKKSEVIPEVKENKVISESNSSSVRNYRLTLTDTGTNDGYFLQHSKEITIFDYANIISEYFGIDIAIDYEEDYDVSVVEKSKNEEILANFWDFLEKGNKNDE